MTLNYAQLIGGPDAGGLLDGFRNRIINGDMRIDQRNDGANMPNVASNAYTVDRWLITHNVASKLAFQQNAGSVTPPPGYTNYAGITVTAAHTPAAGDYFVWGQSIEANNISDLAWGTADAKAVTISFWVRSSVSGQFGLYVRNNPITQTYPVNYTVSAPNTWEYKTITIPGPTSGSWGSGNGLGLQVFFNISSGSTFLSSGGAAWGSTGYHGLTGATALTSTLNATLYITGVQLEVGEVASDFERRNYGAELRLCQRYFQKIIWSRDEWAWANNTVNDFRGTHYDFPVEMRTAPTFTVNQGWNLRASTAVFWNFPNAWIFYSNGKSWQPKKDLAGESGLTNHTQYMLRSNVGTNGGYTAVDIDVSAEL